MATSAQATNLTSLDAFPSSGAFDLIAASLSSDAAKKDAIKKGNAIFAFTLTNSVKVSESWYIDLKKTGAVGKGLAPEGAKPDVVMLLSDADFQKLINGETAAQKLFMGGKLKVKGDVMKAAKAEVRIPFPLSPVMGWVWILTTVLGGQVVLKSAQRPKAKL
jgi:putative sterol carrier protein